MPREPKAYLHDMRQAAALIAEFTAGLDFDAYAEDAMVSALARARVETYALPVKRQVKKRRRGYTHVSAKNQVTLPVEALLQAGIGTGDTLRAEVRGPGEVLLVRDVDPVTQFAGALTGLYQRGELDALRDEWG